MKAATAPAGACREWLQVALKMAAPYLAMLVFWVGFHSAWLAILAYHLQIVWWMRGSWPRLTRPRWSLLTLFVAPSALVGPVLYVVLPRIATVPLGPWLASYGLGGIALSALVPYYALVNPVLEEAFWAPLRERTAWAHLSFAGYHLLILYTLVGVPALAGIFVVLAAASWVWKRNGQRSGSLVPAIASHVVADIGIIVVARLLS